MRYQKVTPILMLTIHVDLLQILTNGACYDPHIVVCQYHLSCQRYVAVQILHGLALCLSMPEDVDGKVSALDWTCCEMITDLFLLEMGKTCYV